MAREMATIAPILPAAEEKDLHTALPAGRMDGDNVSIAEGAGIGLAEIARVDLGQRMETIA